MRYGEPSLLISKYFDKYYSMIFYLLFIHNVFVFSTSNDLGDSLVCIQNSRLNASSNFVLFFGFFVGFANLK
ncbi:hypothetical protein T10_4049 [Trichinella papuae]|uniref:Uncharacterized protein n=1 Tax=Trichinella papuae TaxID=268474 RepID=A0A0V1MJE3_9BILA|nr:hypothetical protein T10_4049 [Trichinella papuae]